MVLTKRPFFLLRYAPSDSHLYLLSRNQAIQEESLLHGLSIKQVYPYVKAMDTSQTATKSTHEDLYLWVTVKVCRAYKSGSQTYLHTSVTWGVKKYIYTHTHTYIHICTHTCVRTYMHTCVCTCMYTYMYTHIYVYTHTYISHLGLTLDQLYGNHQGQVLEAPRWFYRATRVENH